MKRGKFPLCLLGVLLASQAWAQGAEPTAAEKRAEAEQWLTQMEPKIRARSDTINGILQALSGQLNKLPDAQVRANELAQNLHRLGDAQLALAGQFASLADLDAFMANGVQSKAALGDDINMVFTPITPCRIADSRSSSAGKLTANVARTYRNYAASGQGGTAACNAGPGPGMTAGTPSALALTLTATQAEAGGWLTVAPAGASGVTSALNFVPGVDIAASTVVKSAGTGPGNVDFQITPAAAVHVIVDLLGFYAKSEPAALDCTTVASASTAIPAGTGSTTIFAPSCAAGYTQTATFCSSNNRGAVLRDVVASSCQYDQGSAASSGNAYTRCCRVPGSRAGRF